MELSTNRQSGMSAGPIPWTAIDQFVAQSRWADMGIFLPIIRAMDNAYMNHKGGESRTFTREMLRN